MGAVAISAYSLFPLCLYLKTFCFAYSNPLRDRFPFNPTHCTAHTTTTATQYPVPSTSVHRTTRLTAKAKDADLRHHKTATTAFVLILFPYSPYIFYFLLYLHLLIPYSLFLIPYLLFPSCSILYP